MENLHQNTAQPIMGTGGVEDVVTYLRARLQLHRKVSRIQETELKAKDVLSALDSRDEETFLAFLDPAVSFRFATLPACTGLAEVRAACRDFFRLCQTIEHRIDYETRSTDHLIVYGMADYVLRTGARFSIPYCDIWQLTSEGRICSYNIYCDGSFLQAAV